jgi:hypothetical protein
MENRESRMRDTSILGVMPGPSLLLHETSRRWRSQPPLIGRWIKASTTATCLGPSPHRADFQCWWSAAAGGSSGDFPTQHVAQPPHHGT